MKCLFCLDYINREEFNTSPTQCNIFHTFSKYAHVKFNQDDLLDNEIPMCISCQGDIQNVQCLAEKVETLIIKITKIYATVCYKVIESEKDAQKKFRVKEEIGHYGVDTERFDSIRKSIIQNFDAKLNLPDCTRIQPSNTRKRKSRKIGLQSLTTWYNDNNDSTLYDDIVLDSPINSPIQNDDDPDFEFEDNAISDPDFEIESQPTSLKSNVSNMLKLKQKLKNKHAQSKTIRNKRRETRKRNRDKPQHSLRVVQNLGDGKFEYLGYQFTKVDGGYQCSSCAHASGSSIRQNILFHIKNSHRDVGKFPCTVPGCEKTFGSSKRLRRHMEVHNDSNCHMCELCGRFFKTKKSLRDHKARHEGILIQECEICHKKISNKTGLQVHMKTVHQGVKDFQCVVCGLNVTTGQSLKRHMLTHEPKIQKPATYDVPNKSFACELCDSRFAANTNLTYHMQTVHAQEKKFECQVCHRKFAKMKLLTRHAYTHSQDLNEICPTCGKGFKTAVYLRNHLKRHEVVEKNFECEVCHVKLGTKASLVFHINTVHEKQRKFPCDVCGKQFFTSHSLKRHSLSHTTERPHACDLCGGLFQQKSTLNRHISQVHEKIPPKNPRRTPLERRLLKEAKEKRDMEYKLGITNSDGRSLNDAALPIPSKLTNIIASSIPGPQNVNSWHNITEGNILVDGIVGVPQLHQNSTAITVLHTPTTTPVQFSTTNQRYLIGSNPSTNSTVFTEFHDPNYFSQELRDCRNYLRDST